MAQQAQLTQGPVWAGPLTQRNRHTCRLSWGEMGTVGKSVGSELRAPTCKPGDLECFPEPFGFLIRGKEN